MVHRPVNTNGGRGFLFQCFGVALTLVCLALAATFFHGRAGGKLSALCGMYGMYVCMYVGGECDMKRLVVHSCEDIF